MALRRATPIAWKVRGLSDAIDGTNAFPGAMQMLANLIPAPHTRHLWVPRPAATQLTDFTGFTTPAQVEALYSVGTTIYGFIASAHFAGKSEPFAYNAVTGAFKALTGLASANLPTSIATSGDWTPPTICAVGSRIVFTHPGFAGGAVKFGWLDISSFSSNTITGTTHSSASIDALSSNVLQAGWNVGMTIAGAGIPANTTIKSIAANGLSLVLSQAATASAAGVTFTVTGGTAASPQWAAGDTNGNNLAAVPVAVANFNGRAYYAVPGAGTVFSDSGNATQVTSATQALTPNNGLDITAFGGLPVQQSTGGILQALIAFQGDNGMQQITGDPATTNLAMNELGVGVGCIAPNTICKTPLGLAFISGDGLRVIDFLARVSDPIGANGEGVCVPFLSAISPSRMCAAFNQNVLRISVQNGNAIGQPVQEYWFDFTLKVWSGPHSFPAALIQPLHSGATNSFVMAANGINAKLWQSDPFPVAASVYTENGTVLSWTWQTVLLPDNGVMAENSMIETTIALALPSDQPVTVQPLDEQAVPLDTVNITGQHQAATTWNNFIWGGAVWGGSASAFTQKQISWHQAIIFKQASIRMTGTSEAGFVIGDLNMKYQPLGYLLEA